MISSKLSGKRRSDSDDNLEIFVDILLVFLRIFIAVTLGLVLVERRLKGGFEEAFFLV